MNANHFDSITRLFATRRSRRQAIAASGAGLASGALAAAGLARSALGQEATPTLEDASGPILLFLQAFQSGGVTRSDITDGRHTLTLEHGLGYTVYFSDRPDREVGALRTPFFLDSLGFTEDNPPNAALVVETDSGQTEVAVMALYDPKYDVATSTATYEVEVLSEFERNNGFAEADTDLAELLPQFGAAHLFIDALAACAQSKVLCVVGNIVHGNIGNLADGACYRSYVNSPGACLPPPGKQDEFNANHASSNAQCNAAIQTCNGNCVAVVTWCSEYE